MSYRAGRLLNGFAGMAWGAPMEPVEMQFSAFTVVFLPMTLGLLYDLYRLFRKDSGWPVCWIGYLTRCFDHSHLSLMFSSFQ